MPVGWWSLRDHEVPGSAGILPAACARLRHERRAGCPRSRISSEQCEIPRRLHLLGMTDEPSFHTDSEAAPFPRASAYKNPWHRSRG
jgi:hypothetical protein